MTPTGSAGPVSGPLWCGFISPRCARRPSGINSNRGFLIPSLGIAAYAAIGGVAVILGLGVALKVQTSRLHTVQNEYSAFVADVKAKGVEAEKRAQETILRDKKAKENADAQNARLRASNAALSRSLLDARTSRSYVPPAAPGTRDTGRACFDRAELERTLRQFDEGVAGLIGEGDAARIGLDTARDWTKTR